MTVHMRCGAILSRVIFLGAVFLSTSLTFADDANTTGKVLAAGAPTDLSVTVYSTADPAGFDPQQFIAQQRNGYQPNFESQVPGFGVIKEIRPVDVLSGVNTLRFTDVAQFIDPTTVSFSDLDAPDATQVLEQRFKFDLVSPEKLLEKYIDRTITVRSNLGNGKSEEITGKLLSASNSQYTLLTRDGVRLIAFSGDVQLGELPGGLITKPTLEWLVTSKIAGKHNVRTTYQTSGITWRSDYNLVLSADDQSADVGAWVSLMNLTGASYPDARLKLIAGDVQRVQPPMMHAPRVMMMAKAASLDESTSQAFEEKAFFEYHLYTLPRRTTISQNATQQIPLFPTARNVKVEKVLVYYGLPDDARHWIFPEPAIDRNLGNQSNKKVDVYVRLKNTEENHMGMPLPRGKVRVYKQDSAAGNIAARNSGGDGSLEFIGEDVIDHTARNETVMVKLGQAFDVTGERTQIGFNINTAAHVITETIRIKLKNSKKENVKVVVRENLYRWVNWEMINKTDEFTKIDARTIHFDVKVPPCEESKPGEKTVEYTVKYTW